MDLDPCPVILEAYRWATPSCFSTLYGKGGSCSTGNFNLEVMLIYNHLRSTPWIIRICKSKLQRYPLIRRIFIPRRRLFFRFFIIWNRFALIRGSQSQIPYTIWKKISKRRSFSSKMFSYKFLPFGLPLAFNRCYICSFIDKGEPDDISFYIDCPIKGQDGRVLAIG